jgi:hypothetical protein
MALRQMLRFAQCSYPCADFHPMRLQHACPAQQD